MKEQKCAVCGHDYEDHGKSQRRNKNGGNRSCKVEHCKCTMFFDTPKRLKRKKGLGWWENSNF